MIDQPRWEMVDVQEPIPSSDLSCDQKAKSPLVENRLFVEPEPLAGSFDKLKVSYSEEMLIPDSIQQEQLSLVKILSRNYLSVAGSTSGSPINTVNRTSQIKISFPQKYKTLSAVFKILQNSKRNFKNEISKAKFLIVFLLSSIKILVRTFE